MGHIWQGEVDCFQHLDADDLRCGLWLYSTSQCTLGWTSAVDRPHKITFSFFSATNNIHLRQLYSASVHARKNDKLTVDTTACQFHGSKPHFCTYTKGDGIDVSTALYPYVAYVTARQLWRAPQIILSITDANTAARNQVSQHCIYECMNWK